jgi:hypothetical protein
LDKKARVGVARKVKCRVQNQQEQSIRAPPSNSIKNQFGTGAHNTRGVKQNADEREREVKTEALRIGVTPPASVSEITKFEGGENQRRRC